MSDPVDLIKIVDMHVFSTNTLAVDIFQSRIIFNDLFGLFCYKILSPVYDLLEWKRLLVTTNPGCSGELELSVIVLLVNLDTPDDHVSGLPLVHVVEAQWVNLSSQMTSHLVGSKFQGKIIC